GLSTEPVLHVADEAGEPRALQGRRTRIPRRMAVDRGAEAGSARARPEPLHRARRQHLFSREDRRDRRQELPADGGQHDRHERGGVPRHDGARRPQHRGQPPDRRNERRRAMTARITASVYTSHVPAIGAAMDLGKTHEPYWQKVFSGYEFSREWLKANTPDVVFLVYNDHA